MLKTTLYLNFVYKTLKQNKNIIKRSVQAFLKLGECLLCYLYSHASTCASMLHCLKSFKSPIYVNFSELILTVNYSKILLYLSRNSHKARNFVVDIRSAVLSNDIRGCVS